MATADVCACGFLLLLAAAVAVYLMVDLRRSPYPPAQSLLFLVILLFTRVWWRLKSTPRLPLSPEQGAVLVCNHRSSVDPFFIQAFAGRLVHWMVAKEYCDLPGLGSLLRFCETIPVNRAGIDTSSTKAAIRLASKGAWVGMLPEGRINRSDEFMLPVRPGAALVALKARVPILPIYIRGAPFGRSIFSPLLMPARVSVRAGRPIDLSPYYDREGEEGLAGEIMLEAVREIARLAGRDDFQPRLAGRKWKAAPEES